jgi:hypothetical protein
MTKCYTWISKYNGCRDRCAFKARVNPLEADVGNCVIGECNFLLPIMCDREDDGGMCSYDYEPSSLGDQCHRSCSNIITCQLLDNGDGCVKKRTEAEFDACFDTCVLELPPTPAPTFPPVVASNETNATTFVQSDTDKVVQVSARVEKTVRPAVQPADATHVRL